MSRGAALLCLKFSMLVLDLASCQTLCFWRTNTHFPVPHMSDVQEKLCEVIMAQKCYGPAYIPSFFRGHGVDGVGVLPRAELDPDAARTILRSNLSYILYVD